MKPNEVWTVQDALQHLLAVTECFCGKFNPPNERTCYRCRALATWKAAEAEPTDQQALAAIERICGDEACSDLDWDAYNGRLEGPLLEAQKKLSDIFIMAHSMVRSNSCHHVHTDWRKAILSQFPLEPGAEE